MKNYKIFVDLSCDIDEEIVNKYNIGYIPMIYMIDDKDYVSDKKLTLDETNEFYTEMKNGKVIKTSQINPFQYVSHLSDYAKDGIDILYFTLSSGLSNTYNSALIAKDELESEYKDFKFEVIDSKAATGGIGLLCEIAAKNLEAGMEIEENAKIMRELTNKIKHWFYVDDLKYLRRGGRISASKMILANALNIKPILIVDSEGKLESIGKKIGVKKSARELVEKYFESRDEKYNIVYICNAMDIDMANYTKNLILERDNNVIVKIESICPIIGAHAGPGTIALCHIGK